MSHVNAGLQAGTLRHARWFESKRTRHFAALRIWKIVRSRRDHRAKMNIATDKTERPRIENSQGSCLTHSACWVTSLKYKLTYFLISKSFLFSFILFLSPKTLIHRVIQQFPCQWCFLEVVKCETSEHLSENVQSDPDLVWKNLEIRMKPPL